MKLNIPGNLISKEDLSILKYISILFLGWRIIITLIAFFGLSFLPYHISSVNLEWAGSDTDFWIRWANWDGGHFRGIAENGYLPFQVVFFPLYPLLIKLLMFLNIHSLWGGLIISSLSTIGALFYLYKLADMDFGEGTAKKAVLIALAFPTSFYMGTVYSEALFIFLAVAAFYYARKENWSLALILAGFAAVTRLMGLAVIAAIGLEYYLSVYNAPGLKTLISSRFIRFSFYLLVFSIAVKFSGNLLADAGYYFLVGASEIVAILLFLGAAALASVFLFLYFRKHVSFKKFLSPAIFLFLFSLIPFLAFCYFMYLTHGNFAFVDYEKQWNRHIVYPWVPPIDYFNRLWAFGFFRLGQTAHALLEFSFFIFFLVLLIFSYFKLRISYTLFFAASLIIPVSSGTLIAIHRYCLIVFPVMLLLARIKSESFFYLWLYFSLMLQALLLVLYINSYWVS
jgi:hypothetical protein